MAKRLLILGAGISGVGTAILAASRAWKVCLSDQGFLSASQKEELQPYAIDIEEGGHVKIWKEEYDLVVKSPGMSNNLPIVQHFIDKGVNVIGEIEFAFQYMGQSKVIGITGTNGKSTTASLLFHTLKKSGLNCALAGNIGYSFAKQIALNPKDWYVLELSSFQLDDIQKFYPEIAVILNISEDHLDRYESMDNYVHSKFKIAQNQTEKHLLILNLDDPYIAKYIENNTLKPKIAGMSREVNQLNEPIVAMKKEENLHFKWKEEETEISIHDLALKGSHNQYNTMAAGISARALGLRNELIRESFSTFGGLEHRLEQVRIVNDVEFINDSKATNLNSVWFALESMTKPTVLILGGQDKGNDYEEIRDVVEEKVTHIVCLGKDNSKVVQAFSSNYSIIETQSAVDAVQAAYAVAEPGSVVLLAPGCASFDLFKSFEDRGEQFKEAVMKL